MPALLRQAAGEGDARLLLGRGELLGLRWCVGGPGRQVLADVLWLKPEGLCWLGGGGGYAHLGRLVVVCGGVREQRGVVRAGGGLSVLLLLLLMLMCRCVLHHPGHGCGAGRARAHVLQHVGAQHDAVAAEEALQAHGGAEAGWLLTGVTIGHGPRGMA